MTNMADLANMSNLTKHPRYFEALKEANALSTKSIFLAGGITGCPDWQLPMAATVLERTKDLLVFNPRRANFDVKDPDAAQSQIAWEHRHLRGASAVSFWFCKDTLQPITLYELGAWSMTTKHIFVGVEPGYPREADVRIQTKLVRPYVNVVSKIEDLVKQVVDWTRS